MNYQEKAKEELIMELTELQELYDKLKTSYHNDIAKHELVEQELIDAKILNNSIVDSTSDLIWSVDSKTFGLLTFNKALYDFFLNEVGIEIKHGSNEIGSHPLKKYVNTWKEMYLQALENGPFTKEYHLFTGNHILELSFNLLKRDDEVFGISVFGKDITKRRRIEEYLCESNEKLQGIFNNLQDAFFEADKNGKFITISPSALPMFGYKSIDEMMGISTVNLYADLDERDRMLAIMFEKGKIVDYIGLARRKDGTTFWSSLNVQIIYDNAGEFAGTMGVVRDITDRKNHEIELEQKLIDLQWHFDVAIGRELKMIELKEEINSLLLKSGEAPKYNIKK